MRRVTMMLVAMALMVPLFAVVAYAAAGGNAANAHKARTTNGPEHFRAILLASGVRSEPYSIGSGPPSLMPLFTEVRGIVILGSSLLATHHAAACPTRPCNAKGVAS